MAKKEPSNPVQNQNQRYTFDRVVRLVLSAITLAVVFGLLRYLSDVLLPFAAAVVLAYLLNPLVTLLEQKTKRRGVAVGLTLGALLVVGIGFVLLLVPLMYGQVRQFRNAVDKLRDDLGASVTMADHAQAVPAQAPTSPPDEPAGSAEAGDAGKSTFGWEEFEAGWEQYRADARKKSRAQRLSELRQRLAGTYLGDMLDRAVSYTKTDEFNQFVVDAAKQLAMGGWTVVTFVINLVIGLTGLIVVLLYLVFLLLDFPEYARALPSFLPPDYRDSIVEFWEQFSVAMRRYFRGQSVVALLTGAMFAVGFTIIGLPMAVPFALLLGVLNMVPYLQAVGLVPAVMLAGLRAIETDSSFLWSIVLVLLVFGVVQVFLDGFLTPRIMGEATGLRPVAIMLGLFVWGKLLGFLGLLIAIPLTCLGIAYYRRYILHLHPEAAKIRE
jgi:predicted PurR-regulated permease PerM